MWIVVYCFTVSVWKLQVTIGVRFIVSRQMIS